MSEFQIWIKACHEANPDAKIAIKADENTSYKTVKKLMSELQDMNENRYYLITQYKKAED
jgi:biopolymer transporter exbD/tolR family protein